MGTRAALAALAVVLVAGCNDDSGGGSRPAMKAAYEAPITHHRPVVLASGEAPDGRQVRITAFSDAAGPCLTIRGLPYGPRQCGRAPSEEVPPGPVMRADAIAQVTPQSRLELYGALRPAVKRVTVRFRLPSGEQGQRPASVIPIDDRSALCAAEIREPFAYFIAFVPGHAREVVATGLDAQGTVVRRLRYDPIIDSLHPHNFIARELKDNTSR